MLPWASGKNTCQSVSSPTATVTPVKRKPTPSGEHPARLLLLEPGGQFAGVLVGLIRGVARSSGVSCVPAGVWSRVSAGVWCGRARLWWCVSPGPSSDHSGPATLPSSGGSDTTSASTSDPGRPPDGGRGFGGVASEGRTGGTRGHDTRIARALGTLLNVIAMSDGMGNGSPVKQISESVSRPLRRRAKGASAISSQRTPRRFSNDEEQVRGSAVVTQGVLPSRRCRARAAAPRGGRVPDAAARPRSAPGTRFVGRNRATAATSPRWRHRACADPAASPKWRRHRPRAGPAARRWPAGTAEWNAMGASTAF